MAAAQYLFMRGNDVVLRAPVGTRAAGNTSDLLVNGVRWEVYTPATKNVDRIVGAVAKKGSQVHGGGVIVDLSGTSVTATDLVNIMARVKGTGANVGEIILMP